MPGFCRDCLADCLPDAAGCATCGSMRILAHPELDALHIAHLDCDAFYASVEKRDNPALEIRPVIVGGRSRRAVALTACYIARKFGARSAMPMYQALKLCPDAVVVPPDMAKYAAVARQVRQLLLTVTPIIEPVSLDEAYLDLSGTERLHGLTPAKTLARLVSEIARTIGIPVSVGLSCNKFLAKLASDLDKPRGFAVIGRAEAKSFLAAKPVGVLRGVGPALQATLAKDGFTIIGQLQNQKPEQLVARYGDTGRWLYGMANGEDDSRVDWQRETKSISAESTFEGDISQFAELDRILWHQAERVSARAKAAGLGGRTVTLKLKTAGFAIRTRSISLSEPTQLSDVIFRTGRMMLKREATGQEYRLLGIGLSQLCAADECDRGNLLDTSATKRAAAERAVDTVRQKFGDSAISKGRGF
ncbi:MAG TPA: DNA polymerase IV [Micropepsaceae bacterium]|nr:DNA polymerase IV [Micropepsaceae bacterium]